MFRCLFLKECRQILKSLVYYIYILLFVLFITGQMAETNLKEVLQGPRPGEEFYGLSYAGEPKLIMQRTLAELLRDCSANTYSTYPMGLHRSVRLNEEEESQIQEILKACTGREYEALCEEMWAYFDRIDQTSEWGAMTAIYSYTIEPRKGLTYGEFEESMEQVCRIVGKGSMYEKKRYENMTRTVKTYEEAKTDYEDLKTLDHVTRNYMRLFCDYAGIVLAVLPVFLGVARCLRDRRAKVADVLYAKQASAGVLVLSRYTAAVFMSFLPVVALALIEQLPVQYAARRVGVVPDLLAFLHYSLIWLLPEIMVVLAVAFLVTELTGNITGIFLQVLWGLGSMMSAVTLTGDFGLKLVIRWNDHDGIRSFLGQLGDLYRNRGFYALLSLLLIVAAVLVYERKRRKGGHVFGKISHVGR